MNLVRLRSAVCASALLISVHGSFAEQQPLFHANDALAPYDEWGGLHQMPELQSTDFAPRYRLRFLYYFEGRKDLALNPAYTGAVQNSLRRLGYYCGPTDGNYSPEVSEAVAKMQKAYRMRVTGTLTIPVRRALFMP